MLKRSTGIRHSASSVVLKAYLRAFSLVEHMVVPLMFAVGFALLIGGFTSQQIVLAQASDGSAILHEGMCVIVYLAEGTLGAVMAMIAGILVLVATALGGFRMAHTFLFVAVGAFILRSLISVFFPDVKSCTDQGLFDLQTPQGKFGASGG